MRILNVPLIFYEDFFIYIHNNIKTTFWQVVLKYTQKVRVWYQYGACEGNRTLMISLSLDFESSASTSSATQALLLNYIIFFIECKYLLFILNKILIYKKHLHKCKYFYFSNIIVIGPSLIRFTFISAPNIPVSICIPFFLNLLLNSSYNKTAFSPPNAFT